MKNKEIINGEAKESLPQGEFFSIDKEDFSKLIFIAKNFARTEKEAWGRYPSGGKRYISKKNIEFILNEGDLEILATGENGGSLSFPLNRKVEKQARFNVDAKRLFRVLKALKTLSSGEINCGFIKKEEEKSPHDINDYFQIKSGRFRANFRAIDRSLVTEALVLPETEPIFTISSGDFLEVCEQVVFAGAGEEYSFGLSRVFFGVYFKIKENQITLAATDSRRLSQKIIEGAKINRETTFIVPKKNLLSLMKILRSQKKKSGDSLSIFIDHIKDKVFFSHPDFKMSAPLIEGKFPDFEKIIPQSWETKVNVRTKELLDATRRTVSLYTPGKANVPIIVGIGNSKLEITTQQYDYDKGIYRDKTFISIENVEIEGKEEKICLNPIFLLDFLRSVKSKMVNFEIIHPLKPIIFKPADDESYLHTIMPIRMLE